MVLKNMLFSLMNALGASKRLFRMIKDVVLCVEMHLSNERNFNQKNRT